jgi:mannose-6-phosphate isomerase-like protein (cupin superfamily)
MAYRFIDVQQLEPEYGVLRKVREALAIGSFGVNEITLPPLADGYPEHDELKTGQDELYVVLEGGAAMTIDGETVELTPGRYVFVTPESRRHIAPGAEGIRFVAFGVSADHQHEGRH